jgi:hypothetical protein
MKVVVSSKHIAKHLGDIDFEKNSVKEVYHGRFLVLKLKDDTQIRLVTHLDRDSEETVTQLGVQWDKLREVCKSIVDQPIELDIKTNALRMTMAF